MKKLTKMAVALAVLSTVATSVSASSRVIRDNRLKDLGISPVLGRGYSIATNTYQSTCLGKIETTQPSYDLKYRYIEIEQDWETQYRRSFETKNTFKFLFLKNNVNVFSEVEGNTTYHYHYIFADIDVDSYYHSLSEGNSDLSESAASLLTKGDVVGFFDSCGPYYVRSIGRHSSFLGLLRYRTTSAERDVNFELELKSKMRGFFSGGSTDTTISTEFRTETQTKRLEINIWAYGLGKGELADIIPTDIDSFKDSVRDVVKTMQDPNAGRITTMEVAPWIENTQFQDLLELEDEEEKLLFEKKKNLEANAEIISELDRIDRAQVDQYFKASNCRRILEDEYLNIDDDFGGGYEPENTFFSNLSQPNSQSSEISLEAFDAVLSTEKVEEYLIANYIFNYGQPEPTPEPETGALACIKSIHEQGIDQVHFRNIPACVDARLTGVPVSPLLDNYCMPELARVIIPDDA
ncbi:hypothetical protein ABMA77_00855 [Halobacteriovorax sp. RZ-1]|uniref:hypothetical protein n=1 Tax=unclassified Halobacteriovorax TaxID=2639665 RepID=UPI00371FB80A